MEDSFPNLFLPLAQQIGKVVTLEEGCIVGGFGAAIAEAVMDAQIPAAVMRLGVPDTLVDHAKPDESKATLGLTPPQMAERIMANFSIKQPVLNRETVA